MIFFFILFLFFDCQVRDIYRLIASLRLAQLGVVKFLPDNFLVDDSIFLCGERYALYLETEVIEFNFSN